MRLYVSIYLNKYWCKLENLQSLSSFHNLYLLVRQPVEPVDHGIDQLIRPLDPLHQWVELLFGLLELSPQQLRRLPAGGVDRQPLFVLLELSKEALVIVLEVVKNPGLGLEALGLCPQIALQPAQEALDLLLLLLVHLQHPLRQEGEKIVDHIRLLLLGDEAARFVPGQSVLHAGQDLIVLSLGIELLQFRHQAGSLWGGGGEGDATDRKPGEGIYS